MSLIRGVLLAEKFRTQHELNTMSADDQRNTLIVELTKHTNQPGNHFQAMNDETLAGTGAILSLLRKGGIRTDEQLKSISDDDQRNIAIVEIGSQTGMGRELQGLSNLELVLLAMGKPLPGGLIQGSFIRGVLLAGKFKTQHELNAITEDNKRNTLIFELSTRINQSNFQAFNDFDLAGAGALLVFMREAKIRTDTELKKMSADDMRNTLIVELDSQTHLGAKLQSLRNMDLVRLALGVNAREIFKDLPGPLLPQIFRYVFSINSIEILTQKADNDHSDSDWLSIIVTVANPATKNIQTFPAGIHQIGGNIKTGNIMNGPFRSDDITVGDSEIVIINYLVTNLGSSDAEEQFAQAVKVTDKVVGVVGPIAGAVIGFFFGAPQEGFKIGTEIAKGFDTAISTLSDVFDFLNIHFAPPNCNGEVLHDTLTFLPGEIVQSINQLASREYTGTQENERCGTAPVTKVNFSMLRHTF